ncbi:Arsenate reductase thioredoxin-coupled, LMWP family [hydrothermal vent metagenome]|uniref:Arsenate reductase thioredoxin-coupled, LMWP family n=1 Tax=hydrothermal vent metagenome TaxID=652676 RepID=A0A3B0RBA1_9ZZZZ
MLLNAATDNRFSLLVLCTGNSARSIMAEALFRQEAGDCFNVHSAGSQPTGRVNPYALEQISVLDIDFEPRSKSWAEFDGAVAGPLDFVITVCGNAAQEICPCFAGSPRHIHWGLPDPAAAADADKRRAFADCFTALQSRIQQLTRQIKPEMSVENIFRLMQNLGDEK